MSFLTVSGDSWEPPGSNPRCLCIGLHISHFVTNQDFTRFWVDSGTILGASGPHFRHLFSIAFRVCFWIDYQGLKGGPPKWYIRWFLGSGPRGGPGWSQGPSQEASEVKSCPKRCWNGCPKLDFFSVLMDLVLPCVSFGEAISPTGQGSEIFEKSRNW